MRPDIFLQNRKGDKIIIDTKWKRLIGDSAKNYGISQADMYQMYAYHTRYLDIQKVILLYPKCHDLDSEDIHSSYTCTAASGKVTIEIKFFDLERYIKQKDSTQFEEIIA